MATLTIWTPYIVTRTGDSTYAPSSPDASWIVRNLADEILEAITDPAPPTPPGEAQLAQYAWIAGQDPGTGGISKLEIVDPCEFISSARSTTFSDGLRVPYYWDNVTRKCVAPGTGASPVSLSSNPTFQNANSGPVLRNAVIWLIFWGPWSGQATLRTNIISLVQTKLLGTDVGWFATAKADYDGFTYPIYGGTFDWNANIPANTASYNTNDIWAAFLAVIQNPPVGVSMPNQNTFVSDGQTTSYNIYCWIPYTTWRVANPDVATGVQFGWEAYHWVRGFNYTIADPPPPPGSPPSTPTPPPPPGTDASGLGGNMIDGLLSTAWLSNKVPYAIFDLGFPLEIGSIKIDFLDGEKKMYFFNLDWSVDKSTWNSIPPPSTNATWRSSGTSATWETFTFSSIISQYVRIVGHGNNGGAGSTATNDAFGISEVQIWGPDVPGAPPSGGGTSPPPPGTGTGQWVWTGTDWVWVPGGGGSCSCTGGTPSTGGPASGIPPPPTSTGGTTGTTSTTGGTGTDTGTTGPNIPAAAPPIVTIFRDFIDSYNLGVETGDLCATDNFPQNLPLVEIYNSPVASTANYLGMARAGSQCQRVGEAVMTDASQLIGQAPRKVTTAMKRVGTCDGLVYCRIRDKNNNIMQEIGTYPAGVIGLNDTSIDFQNDAANYVLKKGDIIWIEYADASAVDGNTYLMYKTGDKDNYDAINSIFVKYTSTTVPDSLIDLSAVISATGQPTT